MPGENRRARDRRTADFLVKTNQCERRPLGPEEAAAHLAEIDRKTVFLFGVRNTVKIELDGLHVMPDSPWLIGTPAEPTITLLSYAAWRQRDDHVRQLLRGGADPTVRHPRGSVLGAGSADAARVADMLAELSAGSKAAVVFVVKQVVRLRFVAAREVALRGAALPPCGVCGSRQYGLPLDACGHVCCEPCLWRRLSDVMLQDGEMSCPVCTARLRTPGHTTCPTVHDPPGAPPAEAWLCGACSYENRGKRTNNCRCCSNCRSCGALHLGARVPLAPPDGRAHRLCLRAAVLAAAAVAIGAARLLASCGRLCARALVPSGLLLLGGTCALALGARARARAVRALSVQQREQGTGAVGAAAAAAAAPAAPAPAPSAGGAAAEQAPTAAGWGLSPAADEVAVSLTVSHVRCMGESLAFLRGELSGPLRAGAGLDPGAVASAEGALGRCCNSVQVVLEGDVLLADACEVAEGAPPAPCSREALRALGCQPLPLAQPPGERARPSVRALPAKSVASKLSVGTSVHAVGALRVAPEGRLEVGARLVLRARGAGEQGPRLSARAARAIAVARGDGAGGGDAGAQPAHPPYGQRSHKQRFRAQPPVLAAAARARRLDPPGQRDEMRAAAVAGDAVRVRALAGVGVDVAHMRDAYGCPALVLAALHGRDFLVGRLLDEWGADPNARSACGATAASVAAARGHAAVLRVLETGGADLSLSGSYGLSAAELEARGAPWRAPRLPAPAQPGGAYVLEVPDGAPGGWSADTVRVFAPPEAAPPLRLHRLIARECAHPGAGACVIDGGFDGATLERLDAAFRSLPLEPRCKGTAENDRVYLPDTEGWIGAALRAAVAGCGRAAPCEGGTMVQMRFLLYAQAGGGLPAHVDLARTDEGGRRSTHTFILYLTGCGVGGETQLLEAVSTRSCCSVLASVTPVRGRLLLFPHVCPHLARPVLAEGLPKLLLRGEMF